MLGLLHGTPAKEGASLKKKLSNMSMSTSTQNGHIEINNQRHINDHSNGHIHQDVHMQRTVLSPNMRAVSPLPPQKTQELNVTKRSSRPALSASGSYCRYVNTFVSEQLTVIRRRCEKELGGRAPASAYDTSHAGLLEWIRSERLTGMPHKGSSWDRVLIIAQHFADQIKIFSESIGYVAQNSGIASHLMYGHCLLLLELGDSNATALEKAFNMFYQFGIELIPLLRRRNTFSEAGISECLGRVFSDLMNIVTAIAIVFYQAVHSGAESTTIEVHRTFSFHFETYRSGIAEATHVIWEHCLGEEDGHRLQQLQSLLAPQDSVLSFLATNRINITSRPAPFTCTWFQPELTSFLRSDERVFIVEGKSGSGKTTLARWTIDRLQRSIARKNLTTITHFFSSSVPSQSSSLSMVKTLLHQLLIQRVGDENLFHSINEAFKGAAYLTKLKDQEDILWIALNNALEALDEVDADSLVIVIDAIDEIEGERSVTQKVCQRLYALALSSRVRIITFSQPTESPKCSFTRITLTPEYIYNDIATIAQRSLTNHMSFKSLSEPEQERIVNQLAKAADTSVLWVYLACQYIQHCTLLKDAVKEILTTHKSISEAVQKIVSISALDHDARNVISFISAARRPLHVDEVKYLLQAQPDRYSMIDRHIDVHGIINSMRAFVMTGEGLVVIRHNEIKKALTAAGSKLSLESRHKDVVMRLLIYAKTCLIGDHKPTLEGLESQQVMKKLQSHHFLEYAVRYWTLHLKKSSFYKSDGDLDLPIDLNSIFPTSLVFTLLEESCWMNQLPAQEAIELYVLAFQVRKTLFGEKQPCVLQSAIIVARIYQLTLSRASDAVEWYVKASKICRSVLGLTSDTTIALCEVVLHISETLIVTKRNTIMTWREEILLIMISSYGQRYGDSSKEVVEVMHKLVQLYVCIQEEHKIIEWKKKIEIIVSGGDTLIEVVNGTISRGMTLKLKRHQHKEEIDYFEGGFLGGYTAEGEVEFTFDDIEKFLARIAMYINELRIEKAEELYIELWVRLTEYCQHHHKLDWHCKKIQVMLDYASFLHKHKRQSESCTILLCIWREYEHHELTSFEQINILLKEVAVYMESMNLLSVALAIFKKCWSYFKHTHKEENTIYKEIEKYLTSTSTKIVKTTTTTTTSETIIRGVLEAACSSSEVVTETTVELSRSLSSTYVKQEKYSEAIMCIEMALKKAWSSFFLESEKQFLLTTTFTSECIELVMRLAHCYMMEKRYEKVEEIYIRLYRVHCRSCTVTDEKARKYADMLIEFYTARLYFSKAISFYQELLVEYRQHYGIDGTITIKTLYALGDLCRQHHLTHGYWIEYYLEIITSLNKGSLTCHEDALRALVIVAEHHFEAMRFTEALIYFKSIFHTFREFGTKYKYFENITEVHLLIEHYFRATEEASLDIEIHIKIIQELRESCLKYYKSYKEFSSISIMVSMTLATICRRSERHEFKAISLYEFISQHSTTVAKEVKTSLQYLYYKKITTSTTTETKEVVEKATTMTLERYTETRKLHSCTHEKTLTELDQLVSLWYKQGKKELIIKEVQSIVLEIVYVKSSKELVESGKRLGEIYVACGYHSEAYELIRELRMQVIYGFFSDKCTFKLKCGRECLAFVAALEYYVRADWSFSLAILMVDLIAEFSYYRQFTYSLQNKAEWNVIFAQGARIRRIHLRRGRDFGFIENETVNYFCQVEPEVVKHCHRPAIRQFVNLLFKYCMNHHISSTFTTTVGHAAIAEIRDLIKQKKPSFDLTKCTFYFLMAHKGLDDPTEITMGFQLCLMMSHGDVAMVELSRFILAEVFDICKNFKLDIARIQLEELNELIEMIGQQKDYERLHWLLRTLWNSRESQTQWPKEAVLRLGMRLIQAEFAAGHFNTATRLCEDIVYNIKRVNGQRHENTINMSELLASLYTSIGMKSDEKNARFYFKKALVVQEDVLKALVGWEEEDDDDDMITDYNGSVFSSTEPFSSHQTEVDAAVRHIKKLRRAMQRLGGWHKPSHEYERLTDKVWTCYGGEMKLKEDEVKSSKWKAEKPGGDMKYDCFDIPSKWGIVV